MRWLHRRRFGELDLLAWAVVVDVVGWRGGVGAA